MTERTPHIEPRFEDEEFVADYSRVAKRFAGPDYKTLIRYTLGELQDTKVPKVIALGTGPGWCEISLVKRRDDLFLIGLDTSATCIDIANRNAAEMGVADRVVFQYGNACQLDHFKDNSVDAVISSQSFHYWNAPVEALNEIGRVLKAGGVFCITADRRDVPFLSRSIVALSRWVIPKNIHQSWIKSFQGAFTVAEVKDFVRNSSLSDQATVKTRSRMYSIHGRLR